MSGINGIVQNLDRRVGALESQGLEDSATLTQVSKLYADVEVEVRFKLSLHRYRICGDTQPLYGAVCGGTTFI